MTTQVFLDVRGSANGMVMENNSLVLWLNVAKVQPIWGLDVLILQNIPDANEEDMDRFMPTLKKAWLTDLTVLQTGYVAVLVLLESDRRVPHAVVVNQDDGQHEVARAQFEPTAHHSIFIAEFGDVELEDDVETTIASELY